MGIVNVSYVLLHLVTIRNIDCSKCLKTDSEVCTGKYLAEVFACAKKTEQMEK